MNDNLAALLALVVVSGVSFFALPYFVGFVASARRWH
jgi:hypothetical protein